jgi:hypothetical protein
MKIKSDLFISSFFAFLLIIFIIWNRFLRQRPVRDLLSINMFSYFFIITFFLAIIFVWLALYYMLKTLKIIPKPDSKITQYISRKLESLLQKKWFSYFIHFYEKHVMNGLPNFYDKIIYEYVYVKPFVEKIAQLLSNYFFNRVFLIYIIFYVLPKIIPVLILFVEINLTHNINFFYKSLYILLIPLTLNIILHMINHHAKDNIDYLNTFFRFRYDETWTLHIYFRKLQNPKDIEKQESYNLQNMPYTYGNLQCMYDIAYRIEEQKEKHSNMFRSVYFTLLAICSIFQILLMLKLI